MHAHFEHQHTIKIMSVSIFTIRVNLQGVRQLLGTCTSFDNVVVGGSDNSPLRRKPSNQCKLQHSCDCLL